jgi:hypothetical protein
MTDAEKLKNVKTLLGDSDGAIPSDETLKTYLTLAANEILNWKYHLIGGVPDHVVSVPSLEEIKQIYAVVAGYTHAGAEGQSSHSENGISRVFKYGDMLQYIHDNVLPYVRVGAIS